MAENTENTQTKATSVEAENTENTQTKATSVEAQNSAENTKTHKLKQHL